MERRKEVRLEHIAERAGVSIVTVSNALNGRKGVSEQMRRKICQIAESIGYQTAESEEKKESYIIGVAVAERYVKEFPSFYMDIYKRVALESTKRGCMTVLEVVNENQEKMLHGFSAFQGVEIAGIIVIGEMNRSYIAELTRMHEVPIVCVDCYDVLEGVDYVVADSYGGMEQMTDILLESGHEKLMFVGTLETTGSIMDRYLGFCKAFEKRGLKPGPILCDRRIDAYDYKLDVELPEVLPDAFVCNCDKSAGILVDKLLDAGVRIPQDISVVSFDHYYSQIKGGLELTTYENDQKAIAQISVSTLVKKLEGRKKTSGVRIVEGKIIRGNTVRNRKDERESWQM